MAGVRCRHQYRGQCVLILEMTKHVAQRTHRHNLRFPLEKAAVASTAPATHPYSPIITPFRDTESRRRSLHTPDSARDLFVRCLLSAIMGKSARPCAHRVSLTREAAFFAPLCTCIATKCTTPLLTMLASAQEEGREDVPGRLPR